MAEGDNPIVATGRQRVIEYATRTDGSMPAREFLKSLDKKDLAPLMHIFQHLADNGEWSIRNDELFKQERGPFWTFKRESRKGNAKARSSMIRIPCFRHGNRWILTHGFWKPPQSKWPEREFAFAEEIRHEFLEGEKKRRKPTA